MRLGSLFDGSGGFPLAGTLAGIEPVWASEIEPYPIAVTRSRFPNMKHLGSVTGVCGGEIEPVDVITFGSPCQDLSIAGRRAGIHDGERSNLFFEAIRIIREMREKTNGRYPTFAVWENVPGAFSSNNGDDFRCVLEAFCEVCGAGGNSVPQPQNGKWQKAGEILGEGFSVAWRLLDAQYWGVPQRRKRIYLVADFRGERAGKILFERKGLRRDSESGGKTRKEPSCDAERRFGDDSETNCLTPWDHQRCRLYRADGIFPTLGAADGRNNQAAVYSLDSASGDGVKPNDSNNGFRETAAGETLQTEGANTACNRDCDNTPLLLKIRGGCEGGGKGPLIQENKSATLSCHNDQILFQPAMSAEQEDDRATCYMIAHDSKDSVKDASYGGFALNASDWKDAPKVCYLVDSYMNPHDATGGGELCIESD